MPQEVLNWVLWGVGVVLAMVAIAHIASFAKLLGKAYENNEE